MLTERARALRGSMRGQDCSHPTVEHEFDQGVRSEDVVCTRCGKVFFSREDWEKERTAGAREP